MRFYNIAMFVHVCKVDTKIKMYLEWMLNCHVHLNFWVWLVVMENDVINLECVNFSNLSSYFKFWEWSWDTLKLEPENET